MEKRTAEFDASRLRSPVPKHRMLEMRPTPVGYEVYWERVEERPPECLGIYPQCRTVSGSIFLDRFGCEVGRMQTERDWQDVKEGKAWAEEKALISVDPDKVNAEVNALKFYQPGAKPRKR
jgi:hypothetical protein